MENSKMINKDFLNEKIKDLSSEFYLRSDVISFLQSNSQKTFINLVDDFWNNPNQNATTLKKKHKIPNSISVYDIIKSHFHDTYISFLLDSWDSEISVESILQKYLVPYSKMDNLIFPIGISQKNLFCPSCLISTELIISTPSIKDFKEGLFILRCKNCQSALDINKLLTSQQANEKLQHLKEKQTEFLKNMAAIQDSLKDIKCFKCQSDLLLCTDQNNLTYSLQCSKCKTIINDISIASDKYKAWKKRAAMMIAIKAKEQEIIEKVLESKKPSQTIFKSDDWIVRNESIKVIDFFFYLSSLDSIKAWTEIYNIYKTCNKVQKDILLKIVDLCEQQNNTTTWIVPNTNEKIEVYRYSLEDIPVINILYNKTGYVWLRKELRILIEKKLIFMDEESNIINIFPLLLKSKSLLLDKQPSALINNHLRYLVFERNNFKCYRCGENGRPLKLTYLSMDKNNHDLDLMTCLCDYCFSAATENEVLIDGTITFKVDVEETTENDFICWNFIISQIPYIKDERNFYDNLLNLTEKYNQLDMINAFAYTIDRLKNNKFNGSVSSLLNYTKKVLEDSPEGFKARNDLFEKYKLQEWIDKL